MLSIHRRAGISTIPVVIALLFFVGLFLGPFQGLYCLFISGKSAGKYPITINEPTKLTLSPDMNPIRFNARIRYEAPNIITGLEDRTTLACRLNNDEQTFWEERVHITEKDDDDDGGGGISIQFGGRSKTSTTPIHSFFIEQSGDYDFTASSTSQDDLKVHEVNLLVRQNVRQINIPSLVVGLVLMASPLLLCFKLFRRGDAKA